MTTPAPQNPIETATEFADGLQGVLDEVKSLREVNDDMGATISALKKKLDHADQWNKRLRQKCDILEREPVVMDGWDELACWENKVTIQFKDSLTGRARVVVKGRHFHKEIQTGKVGEPLLRRALNSAFRRDRKELPTQELPRGKKARVGIPPGAKHPKPVPARKGKAKGPAK